MDYVNQIISKINLNTLIANQQLICENVLFSIGPLSALFAARLGYKTYRKYEFFVNLIFAVVLIGYPQPLLSLLVIFKYSNFFIKISLFKTFLFSLIHHSNRIIVSCAPCMVFISFMELCIHIC